MNQPKSRKPNILLVFSDQHRASDLGCFGNPDVITPSFDLFAQSAMSFFNCISNTPLCVPARGSLLTGLLPNRHRAITNDLPIDPHVESIATVMNRCGYRTGYIGKWHLDGIPRDKAIQAGDRLDFTEWKACNCNHDYFNGYYFDEDNSRHAIDGYEPIGQTNLAIDFIKRNREQTWGLVLSYGPPHDPYDAVPERYQDLYRDAELALRGNVPDMIMDRKDRFLTREEIVNIYRGYYAHITALDEQFGRIIKTLELTGQLDQTIVVYTADHGDMLGSHGLTNKQLPYDESIKVPLLVRAPVQINSGNSHELISLVDLPVSLMRLAGLKFDNPVDGLDLHRLFVDKDAPGADAVYIVDYVPCHQPYHRGSQEWRGIVTRRYTYARSTDSRFCILFDNGQDRLQQNNLADHLELRQALELELNGFVSRHDAFLPWDEFIIENGYRAEWNASQRYFNLPVLKEAIPYVQRNEKKKTIVDQ